MTEKQKEIVRKNLDSFVCNFGGVRIEKANYGKGFLVFYPMDREDYIQYCPDINYLNGWLYGVVQGDVVRKLHEKEGK